MPSPFPGMDPYLEEPSLWTDVHHEFISVMREMLNSQLVPKYFARVEQRIYISDERDPGRRVIAPDLRVIQGSESGRKQLKEAEAGIATVEPLEVTTLIEEEIHEPHIQIIDHLQKTVVTVIEVLSPANKVRGSRGRDSYESKREQVIRSNSHFIEIDLLRAGEGFPPYEALPPHEYRVHLSRVGRGPKGTIWPIRLAQRLPPIPIPLRGDDPDTKIDLQAVLGSVYERGAYQMDIDYRSDPPSPQPAPTDMQWIDQLLRETGMR